MHAQLQHTYVYVYTYIVVYTWYMYTVKLGIPVVFPCGEFT